MNWPGIEQRRSLEAACLRYQAQLGDEGTTYLRGRALSEDVAKTFRIGRVGTDPLPEHRQYTGRLVLPVLREGTPVQMLFRCIQEGCKPNTDEEHHEGHPKVLGPSGERRWLFNMDALMDSTTTEIDICEGEWDAIALSDATGLAAVGVPGSKRWKPSRKVWRRLFEGHAVVRMWADPGEAGEALAAQIKDDVPWARIIELPHDVNKMLQLEGAGYLMEAAGL